MFTETMTFEDFSRISSRESGAVERTKQRVFDGFLKRVRKNVNRFPVFETYAFKTHDKNSYLFTMKAKSKKWGGLLKYMTFESQKGRCYVFIQDPGSENSVCVCICSHFLRRYRERELEDQDIALDLVLAIFSSEVVNGTTIYWDEHTENGMTKCVVALPKGLILAHYDEKRNVVCWDTYVSDNMLQLSQRLAKECVMKSLKANQKAELVEGMRWDNYLDVIAAGEIYKKYYENPNDYLEFVDEEQSDKVRLCYHLKTKKNEKPFGPVIPEKLIVKAKKMGFDHVMFFASMENGYDIYKLTKSKEEGEEFVLYHAALDDLRSDSDSMSEVFRRIQGCAHASATLVVKRED